VISRDGQAPGGGDRESVERLEHEVDELRADLARKIDELARRGKALVKLPARARRHPRALLGVAVVVLGGVTGLLVRRRRRAQRRPPWARRRASGGHPAAKRLLAAAGTAAASVLGRQLARRLLRQM
jgi:hypothetical protein